MANISKVDFVLHRLKVVIKELKLCKMEFCYKLRWPILPLSLENNLPHLAFKQ